MLRAIGMTRRQARRMIRHESVTISLIGAALGIPVGVFLAALATTALSRYDIVFSLPVTSLVAFVWPRSWPGCWPRSCPRAEPRA